MKNSKSYRWSLAQVIMACLIICLIVVTGSCGSTWRIEGNKINVQKGINDTINQKRTIIILNDSNLIKNGK